MTEKNQASFRCEPMAGLARQLRYTPPNKRVAQVLRAERLHDRLDPDGSYPVDFVHYRITGYRSESLAGDLMTGVDLMHDLRQLIGELSKSAPLVVTEDEPVESTSEVASRLGVAGKTVMRWRDIGLRWRWVRRSGKGRRQIGYTAEAVSVFLRNNPDRVRRASRMTHLGREDHQKIIADAKKLASTRGATLNSVAAKIAKTMGRAHQTIRLILEKHDQGHPAEAIFVDRRQPIDLEDRRAIVRLYRQGVRTTEIASRYARDRALVYRTLRLHRAAVVRRVLLPYVLLAVFERDDADTVILRSDPPDSPSLDRAKGPSRGKLTDHLPEPLGGVFGNKPAAAKLHRSLLIRLNYLKYKAHGLREGLNRYSPSAKQLDQIELCIRRAGAIRDWCFLAGLPVVLSVARRHLVGQEDDSLSRLGEVLEVGVQTLAVSIDEYNPGRSDTFSTYVSWQLMRELAAGRAGQDNHHVRARKRVDGWSVFRRLQAVAARHRIHLRAVEGD